MHMNVDDLKTLREEVETKFNEKKSARDKALTLADSLLGEMNYLKGSYETYTELINKSEDSKPSVKVKGE